MKKTNTALIMVSEKKGIEDFARELLTLGFTIYGSKGTVEYLSREGVKAIDIATIVGEPIMGHRVVSLSREIYAAVLARETEEDMEELKKLNLPMFDLICVDFYPLEKEINKPESTLASVIESTDIGGPTVIRAGAKSGCLVISSATDRQSALEWLKAGRPENGFLEAAAAKGEHVVSKYSATSATYRSQGKYQMISGEEVSTCKYGENAYQTPAALFSSQGEDKFSLDKFKVIEGTSPSYNNWCDIDRMLQTITHIGAGFKLNYGKVPFIALGAKHGNVCGASVGDDPKEVLSKMMTGDPLSIFGGLIMTNFTIEENLIEVLSGKLLDGIIAPKVKEEAIAGLKRKNDKCRFVINQALAELDEKSLDDSPRIRYVRGGFLRQPNYTYIFDLKQEELKKYGEDKDKEKDMILAWGIGSTSNSNTITLVKNGQLLGNGVGQQDRVGAAKLAIERAIRSKHDLVGSTAYSDSFFPFPDAPEVLIDQGIKSILTTYGSKNDPLTIDLCQNKQVILYMIPDFYRGFFGH